MDFSAGAVVWVGDRLYYVTDVADKPESIFVSRRVSADDIVGKDSLNESDLGNVFVSDNTFVDFIARDHISLVGEEVV